MRSDLPGQLDLPQTEENTAAAAMLRGAMPLKPKQPQKPMDIGLFSDEANQLDLIEMFMD
jgi:hypothetical protein